MATALTDQTDDGHRWVIDPDGPVAFWTQETPSKRRPHQDVDELDLFLIGPLLSLYEVSTNREPGFQPSATTGILNPWQTSRRGGAWPYR